MRTGNVSLSMSDEFVVAVATFCCFYSRITIAIWVVNFKIEFEREGWDNIVCSFNDG